MNHCHIFSVSPATTVLYRAIVYYLGEEILFLHNECNMLPSVVSEYTDVAISKVHHTWEQLEILSKSLSVRKCRRSRSTRELQASMTFRT